MVKRSVHEGRDLCLFYLLSYTHPGRSKIKGTQIPVEYTNTVCVCVCSPMIVNRFC